MLVKDTACKAHGKIFKPRPLTSENLPLDALSFPTWNRVQVLFKRLINNHFICNLLLYKEHVEHKIARPVLIRVPQKQSPEMNRKEEQA